MAAESDNEPPALPGITKDNQKRLGRCQATILGIEPSSLTAAAYLSQAQIGRIVLVDDRAVLPSDTRLPLLFTAPEVGTTRVAAARKSLLSINTRVDLVAREERFNAHNAEKLIEPASVVVDGLPVWQDKLLASDACMQLGKPFVHLGLHEFRGQLFTMVPGKSACLRCVLARFELEDFATDPPAYTPFPALAGMAGALQALECLKLLSGFGTIPATRLLRFDLFRRDFTDADNLAARPDCPDCGRQR